MQGYLAIILFALDSSCCLADAWRLLCSKLVLPVQKHVFAGAFLNCSFSCLFLASPHQISPCINAWARKGFLTSPVAPPVLWSKRSKAVPLAVPAFPLSAVSWVFTCLSKLVIHMNVLSYVGRITEEKYENDVFSQTIFCKVLLLFLWKSLVSFAKSQTESQMTLFLLVYFSKLKNIISCLISDEKSPASLRK